MSPKSLTVPEIQTLLAETAPRIAALTSNVTPARLRTAPKPNEWSANDILAHLRACADVWGGCIEKLLTQDKPTWRALSPRTYIKRTDYPDLQVQTSLLAFTNQRAALMPVLMSLTDADWSRTATVTGAGAPLQPTLLSFAERMARHEREHLRQLKLIVDSL